MSLPEVHLVGGTCAEALRLAPVVFAMRDQARVRPIVLAAGSHPADVARTFAAFGLSVDVTLPVAEDRATAVRRLDQLWAVRTPSAVVVRGDNLAAALAAYWRRIPIMHVDAGRRTGWLGAADGGDADRRLLAQVATVHLAATAPAAMNLLDENVVAGDVLLTGGTTVEATQILADRAKAAGVAPAGTNRLILVGVGTACDEAVSMAVRELTRLYPDLDVAAAGPLPYPERARLVAAAYVVLTDDEDLAEEAVAAGAPVIVPGPGGRFGEALQAGVAKLVEPLADAIVAEVSCLLESRVRRDGMIAAGSPYGDGLAAGRVAQATAALLGHGQFPEPMPARPTAGVPR